MTAPLQVIALSFNRDAGAEDRILDEVDRLRGRGVLRLLDMLFVAKSQDGTIERLTIGDDEDFGSLLAAVVPVADGGPAGPAAANGLAGFAPADALALADSLEPGTALAFLLVEHHWAAPLFDAIAETGGTLIGEGFLTSEAGLLVGAEVAALEEAAEVIAQAQAEEAGAVLAMAAAQAAAVEAVAESVEAVAESQRIQSAAAAGALRALITAGLVEEAAAHEAVTALTAVGLIVADADQAAADAVAEDAATVEAADEVAAESLAESLITIAAADEEAAESVAESLITIAAAGEEADQAASEAGARVRAASITMAEAQVLRYLPTPLPFSVIAGKLGISRSAAKERAVRLYNRLGVHSRDEAVSRARALGLIHGK
jgi:DNA-binding NarL/FixJ family response regulator